MKAVTWQGSQDMRVQEVPDPTIQDPGDVIVKITSTGLCGSDLHLYEPLGPFMTPGDVVGHEPMGIVEQVGPGVETLVPGDRVVVPFNVSCGTCWMCSRGLHSQCETTQNRDQGTGASLFGYSKLYGQVPGGQAELLRVPFGDTLPIKVPHGPPDDRFLFLSDVLPTAWQAVEYANVGEGDTVLIIGGGPIGAMAARIAARRGIRVVVSEPEEDRRQRAAAWGAEVVDEQPPAELAATLREMTDGRGPDAVIDAVGMEAHGSPIAELAQKAVKFLPDAVAEPLMKKAAVDRLVVINTAIETVRRGGTISISGVYGGAVNPLPLMQIFDKQIQLRMGQANVHRWSDEILELLTDEDPLGTEGFATHHLPLSEAPEAYKAFRDKQDGMIKVVFQP
ncbi:alcohol dehydrogenase catalytic domain-containing protein [Nocardioides sp. ChNu-153]|uniref:alcohol dehydrogenase catalytic domain-containing protein n=1 Tax=unclassified Nocardioides TaxID=2615069 RepID=UPI0024068CE4|nr:MULTISPECIES: alcohol dehydrogenase catalytic domain-containing protein [unclassified Nocardioides]MDF9714593.1 alcohol dehydrogenase catalytic domain-containing protein [Nocardioides sp. ChNu-99]MDN7119873.1 alcohol dehydrogenase catalytic domain-containing protein [Nocardioides sp. ChNu-153]